MGGPRFHWTATCTTYAGKAFPRTGRDNMAVPAVAAGIKGRPSFIPSSLGRSSTPSVPRGTPRQGPGSGLFMRPTLSSASSVLESTNFDRNPCAWSAGASTWLLISCFRGPWPRHLESHTFRTAWRHNGNDGRSSAVKGTGSMHRSTHRLRDKSYSSIRRMIGQSGRSSPWQRSTKSISADCIASKARALRPSSAARAFASAFTSALDRSRSDHKTE